MADNNGANNNEANNEEVSSESVNNESVEQLEEAELSKDIIEQINSTTVDTSSSTGSGIGGRTGGKNDDISQGSSSQGAWPISDNSKITSGYNLDKSKGRIHRGLDFSGAGKEKYALAYKAGTVAVANDKEAQYGDGSGLGGYGKVVIVKHAKNEFTLYAHLAKPLVSKGQKVKQGEKLGIVGNTGNSSGKHLHFELRDSSGYTTNTKKPNLDYSKKRS